MSRANRHSSVRPRLSGVSPIRLGSALPPLAELPPWTMPLVLLPILMMVGLLAGINPAVGLFAAFGLIFILVALTDLATGVAVLILVVFIESAPITAISADKLVGLILAGAWVVRLSTQPSSRERQIFSDHPAFSYLLVLFLGWVLLSTAWAENSANALGQFSDFLLVAVLYVIVYTAIRTRRQAMIVIGAFVAGSAYTAAYGLVNKPTLDTVEAGRLVSTIADPNFLAASLIAGTALAGAGIVAARGRPILQLASGGALASCLAAFVLTGSRGGIVGLTVALLTAIVVSGRWRAATTIAVMAVVGFSIGYYTLYAPPEVKSRIEGATQGETQQQDGRSTIWTVGWRMVEDNPIIGVGAGNFEDQSVRYVIEPGRTFRTDRVIDNPGVSHNSYLGPLAELGIIGALLFVSIIGFSVAAAYRAAIRFARSGDRQMEALSRGLLVACVGILAAGFFISAEASKQIWLLLALCPALLAIAAASENDGPEEASSPR